MVTTTGMIFLPQIAPVTWKLCAMFSCSPALMLLRTTMPPFLSGARSAELKTACTLYAADVPALSITRFSLKSSLVATVPLILDDFTTNCGRTNGSGAVVAVGGGIGVGARTVNVAEPLTTTPDIET